MQTHEAKPAGFVLHPMKGWLGASPDACLLQDVHTEFKCPYSKCNECPKDACKDSEFCCSLIDGNLQLKRHHPYYHQVQLQLYVTSELCKWCDICIYATQGIAVEKKLPGKKNIVLNWTVITLNTFFQK